jgi:hypothetical protein
MAEVYWDREYDLQQQGFDFTYDKRLYDRLAGDLGEVRSHLGADPGFQDRSARFLENHDEPRAASVFGVDDRQRAAAVVSFLCPGLRFFHDGQFEGRRRHVSVHVCRAPDEPTDAALVEFYEQLLGVLRDDVTHDGTWALLDVHTAWDGNPTNAAIVAYAWTDPSAAQLRFVVVANLADHWSQGYIPLPVGEAQLGSLELVDRVGTDRYQREGLGLATSGLYLDIGPFAHQVFEVRPGA